jgi:thiol:disulfide interchange protein DsbD
LLLASLLLAAFTLAAAAEEAKPAIAWLDDFGAALEKAKKENRPIFLDFYTTWCLYCGKLEKETFGDPRVSGLAREFVCVRLDADVHKGVAARYQPEGFPTVILAAPTGDELFRVSGFRNADQFYTVLKAVKDHGAKMSEDLGRIDKDPKDFAAQEDLGKIYLDLGLAEKAQEHLQAALKSVPGGQAGDGGESDEARIQFLLARAAITGNDYGKASKLLQKLIDANPNGSKLPQYYLEMGRALKAAGKTKKAEEAFATLSRQFPDSPEAEAARALPK